MAETYDKIFREVVLRANLLTATDATTLETNYTDPDIGATEMVDRATQFPKSAVDDAILNAGDKMVGLIGLDRFSPYRLFFQSTTNSLATGSVIPTLSSTGKEIKGILGDIRDSVDGTKLEASNIDEVNFKAVTTLKQGIYLYYTDNFRIWHTRANIVADVVIWDKADQRTLLTSTPNRGNCPFPQELHEGLVNGALSYIFRASFNDEQVKQWKARFDETIAMLSANIGRQDVEARIKNESE